METAAESNELLLKADSFLSNDEIVTNIKASAVMMKFHQPAAVDRPEV